MLSIPFARCLARISGDGTLSGRYLRYTNTCPELLEEFKQDVRTEFGDITITEGVGNSGTSFVQVQRKHVLAAFLVHLDDFRSGVIKIPAAVLSADQVILTAYLQAFFDDEGCAAIRIFKKTKEWKRNVTLTSNSLYFLEQTKELLLVRYGIVSNCIIRTRALSYYDKSYVLSITGKKNLLTFQSSLSFRHPFKKRCMDLIARSYDVSSKSERFKELEEELCEIRKGKRWTVMPCSRSQEQYR